MKGKEQEDRIKSCLKCLETDIEDALRLLGEHKNAMVISGLKEMYTGFIQVYGEIHR